ncbi:MAG: DHH family phosphoesterase [Flammeovirgaceae bacterium]|nr:DHH family phosphoesterase [Flammeovirgaceae bacterium]
MKKMKEIKDLLSLKSKILITTHVNPDGDAIGSSLALYNFLIKMGHDVTVVVPNDYPDFLKWMKSDDKIINFSEKTDYVKKLLNKIDIIFCLDFNNLKRINELGDLIQLSNSKKVLIDHHLNPDNFYDYKYHNVDASATAELVYDLISFIDENLIDKDISDCIYTGILTDTGSFRFASTSSKVHRIIAKLLDKGVRSDNIGKIIYESNSFDKLKLLGYSLSKKLEIICGGRAAYIVLTRKDLSDNNYKKGDTEGIVNYALSIAGVNMATLIIETKERIKFSFRSSGDFSVNHFANSYFNGGGHKNAAGGSLENKLSVALDKFLKSMSKHTKELNY